MLLDCGVFVDVRLWMISGSGRANGLTIRGEGAPKAQMEASRIHLQIQKGNTDGNNICSKYCKVEILDVNTGKSRPRDGGQVGWGGYQ